MQTSINETLQSQPIAAVSMTWTIDYRITDSAVPFSVAMSPAEIDKRNAAQRCMKLARQRMATHYYPGWTEYGCTVYGCI